MNSDAPGRSQDATTLDPRRWVTLAIAASALFLICVDLTVLYIALPSLTRDLGAGNEAKLWIVNIYPLVVAGLLPGFGTLGDRHGHRRLFLAGLLAFGVASLAAAFAPNPAVLIAARAGLGIGGAMMMPATLAIIRVTFSNPQERSLAIGLWAGIASGGMAVGPVIGGLLLSKFWWGSVFLINVPVVLLALVMTLWLVPRDAPAGGPAWDLMGSLQIMGGLLALVYAIKSIAHQPFSLTLVVTAVVACAVIFVFYQRRQQRRAAPLIDFSLFRLRGFPAAVAGATLGTAGIVGIELALGQYLQLVQGLAPLQAAWILMHAPLGAFIAGPIAGWLLHRFNAVSLTIAGLLLSALCALLLSHGVQVVWMLGVGAGVGITATCASSAIMSAAPPGRGGMAASIEEVGFELGGAIGVAIFGSVLTLAYLHALDVAALAPDSARVARRSIDEALIAAERMPPEAAMALAAKVRTAFGQAMQAVMVGAALLWGVTAAAILVAHRRR